MKNTKRQYMKEVFCIFLLVIAMTSSAQILPCDTCTYDYDRTWTPKQLDSVVAFQPENLGEYQGCGSGTIRHKNIIFIHKLYKSIYLFFLFLFENYYIKILKYKLKYYSI